MDEFIRLVDAGQLDERTALETVVLFYGSGSPNPATLIASSLNHFARDPHPGKYIEHSRINVQQSLMN
ncbi:hypothetical protein LRM35_21880 [Klebsiella variicola subsp. variicola]|nr:hypothetical protein LRM35_21880 [Klebsiella variicola subsp. variicola]